MKKFLSLFLSLSMLLGLSSCVYQINHKMRDHYSGALISTAFIKLSNGMSKDDVLVEIGEPDVVRSSIMNKHSQLIEVWQYRVDMVSLDHDQLDIYWLYFQDNKLIAWGKPDDFKKIKEERKSDYVSEIRYR